MTDINPTLVVLTDKSLLKGVCGSISPTLAAGGTPAACYFPDSKRPQVWYRESTIGAYREYDVLNGGWSGYFFNTAPANASKAIQIDMATGDVYALETLTDGTSRIIKRSGFSTTAIPVALGSGILLKNASDFKIDSSRRVMWIADSCNHRVLKIGMRNWKLIKSYSAPAYVLPCSLVINPNTGDAFVRWYLSSTKAEVISRLSSSIAEWYSSVGGFEGQLSPCQPLDSLSGQSMAYDGTRDRLWWIANSKCNKTMMVDMQSGGGRALDIYRQGSSSSSGSNDPILTCIQVDELTGRSYAGFDDGMGTTFVVQIDPFNYSGEYSQRIANAGKPQAILVNRVNSVFLPFSITGIALPSLNHATDIGFTITGTNAPVNLASIDQQSVGLAESAVTSPETKQDVNDVLIWAQDNQGLGEVKRGSLRGLPQENFQEPTSIIKLPVFSWAVKGTATYPLIIVGDSAGHLKTFTVQNTSLHAENSVSLASESIKGVAAYNFGGQIAAVCGTSVFFLDPNTLAKMLTVQVDLEVNCVSFDASQDVWIGASGDGKIGVLTPEESSGGS